jgi:hypothetical protein
LYDLISKFEKNHSISYAKTPIFTAVRYRSNKNIAAMNDVREE